MTLEEMQKVIAPDLQEVEELIQSTLLKVENSETQKWMQYFCKKSGHRLRPMLTIISFRCIKENASTEERESLIKLATILELLHTASLIHDDVIDHEEIRREQRALHHLVGNKNAILIGNVFYLKAFELASTLPNLEYFSEITRTSLAMCFGEVTQGLRLSNNTKLTREEYMEVVENKTGRLISSCCFLGSKLSGASSEMCTSFQNIGLMLGTLYQMRDDIKDADANIESSVSLKDIYLEIVKKLEHEFLKLGSENTFVKMLKAFFTIITKNIK